MPAQLKSHNNRWHDFAYAEQYKRSVMLTLQILLPRIDSVFSLILFFFMWDTQNVSLYSFMPTMSNQTVQVEIPCSEAIWNAQSEVEWLQLIEPVEQLVTLPRLLNDFVEDKIHLRPERIWQDKFTMILVLYGLMSMCNDILHFDNRSMYLDRGDSEETDKEDWPSWRDQMATALDFWRSKYDAYNMMKMGTLRNETDRAAHRRDSMSILALYHTAHIMLSVELRHLQIAAGAKAIFGQLVTQSDHEQSTEWISDWVRSQPKASSHAAWHAAQLFREGLLNLDNWDVLGVIHYPWCLYISALTIWAWKHFSDHKDTPGGSRDPQQNLLCCDGPYADSPEEQAEAASIMAANAPSSKASLHNLISTMAAVPPEDLSRVISKCCYHGLTYEIARKLREVRWTAAFEAMKVLKMLSEGACG